MIEPHSETWRTVEKWARAELEKQERLLKDPMLPHDQTQVVRGDIKRLEELLALPSPKVKPKVPAGVPYDT